MATTKFEKDYNDIGGTELWQLFKTKADKEGFTDEFIVGVETVCEKGILLSKAIIRFFPKFTLHDITHIRNVCRWMINLLGDRKDELKAKEAALLVMAACCHDMGMSVDVDQEDKLLANRADQIEYFGTHLKDEEEYSVTKTISPKMKRNYVRENHHKRIHTHLQSFDWPQVLQANGINEEILVKLCKSHGEALSKLDVPRGIDYDLRLCAVLLRLADILDFDSTRAPQTLFENLGLDSAEDYEQEISKMEWRKNQAGGFETIHDGEIDFTAEFSDLELEIKVQDYIKWVKQELISSSEYISTYNGTWSNLKLPHKINTDNIVRKGYKFGDFQLTMDQDRVIELLSGQGLYNDPSVFVRELLQNSIDAILTRRTIDLNFGDDAGRIVIRTWRDDEGFDWFRIEDDGIGMDENIITRYFLKVGRSYYTSDDFKADKRRYGKGKDYTAISRFGIGILSCFMSNPEKNRIEVSTRKFTRDPYQPNAAIRLNVDGLHGYYYLAKEHEQDDQDGCFKKMSTPPDITDSGYRTEIGTTICVRTNLYQLGSYLSFKDIVDKYVQFPAVCIEYYGPGNEYKKYNTKNDFDRAIEKLVKNEDVDSIEYEHILPESVCDKFLKKYPLIKFNSPPVLKIHYYLLSKLSTAADKQVSGVVAYVSLDISTMNEPVIYDHKEFVPKLRWELTNDLKKNNVEIKMEITSANGGDPYEIMRLHELKELSVRSDPLLQDIAQLSAESINDEKVLAHLCEKHNVTREQFDTKQREIDEINCKSAQFNELKRYFEYGRHESVAIDYSVLQSLLLPEEVDIIQLVWSVLLEKKNRDEYDSVIGWDKSFISYNGILADKSNLFSENDSCMGCIILLSGDYLPEVNVARNWISGFQLKTACDLSYIEHRIQNKGGFQFRYSFFTKYSRRSTEELVKLVENDSVWESMIRFDNKTINDLKNDLTTEDTIQIKDLNMERFYDVLRLAQLRKHFIIQLKNSGWHDRELYISKGNQYDQIKGFPAMLFFKFIPDKSIFALFRSYKCPSCFNIDHPLSQWIIAKQDLLREKIPGIYHNLIDVMINANDVPTMVTNINIILEQIKNLNHAYNFEIKDTLFLSENDINR